MAESRASTPDPAGFQRAPSSPKIVGSEVAPSILCDGYRGVQLTEGLITIRLIQNLMPSNEEDVSIQRVVAHLAMPVGTLQKMHGAIGQLIADLKHNGVLVEADGEKAS